MALLQNWMYVLIHVIPSQAGGKQYDALRRIPQCKTFRTFILDM
jgi:hypothetical protein